MSVAAHPTAGRAVVLVRGQDQPRPGLRDTRHANTSASFPSYLHPAPECPQRPISAAAAPILELTSVDDFRTLLDNGDLVVITDSAKPAKLHPAAARCSGTSEDNFSGKVIERGGRGGKYFTGPERDGGPPALASFDALRYLRMKADEKAHGPRRGPFRTQRTAKCGKMRTPAVSPKPTEGAANPPESVPAPHD
jgi:hypothetical protein